MPKISTIIYTFIFAFSTFLLYTTTKQKSVEEYELKFCMTKQLCNFVEKRMCSIELESINSSSYLDNFTNTKTITIFIIVSTIAIFFRRQLFKWIYLIIAAIPMTILIIRKSESCLLLKQTLLFPLSTIVDQILEVVTRFRDKILSIKNYPPMDPITFDGELASFQLPRTFVIVLLQMTFVHLLFSFGNWFIHWKLKKTKNNCSWKVTIWLFIGISYIMNFIGNLLNIVVVFVVCYQMKLTPPFQFLLPIAYALFVMSTSCPNFIQIQYLMTIVMFSFKYALVFIPYGEWAVLGMFMVLFMFLYGQIYVMNRSTMYALLSYFIYLLPSYNYHSLPSESLIWIYFTLFSFWSIVGPMIEKKILNYLEEDERKQKELRKRMMKKKQKEMKELEELEKVNEVEKAEKVEDIDHQEEKEINETSEKPKQD